jgi:ankyrin repeat protein
MCGLDKRTPLHWAAAEGNLNACKVIVSYGGDVGATDFWGRTPLDDAKASGNNKCVLLLEPLFNTV